MDQAAALRSCGCLTQDSSEREQEWSSLRHRESYFKQINGISVQKSKMLQHIFFLASPNQSYLKYKRSLMNQNLIKLI